MVGGPVGPPETGFVLHNRPPQSSGGWHRQGRRLWRWSSVPPKQIGFVSHDTLSQGTGPTETGFVCTINHNSFPARYLPFLTLGSNWLCFAQSVPPAPVWQWQIGFVLHNRPPDTSRADLNWLCLYNWPGTAGGDRVAGWAVPLQLSIQSAIRNRKSAVHHLPRVLTSLPSVFQIIIRRS
jgi:hypothetical protein